MRNGYPIALADYTGKRIVPQLFSAKTMPIFRLIWQNVYPVLDQISPLRNHYHKGRHISVWSSEGEPRTLIPGLSTLNLAACREFDIRHHGAYLLSLVTTLPHVTSQTGKVL